jgi:Arc/MetJ-type ribon-helix-helix transcriptional regulator
MAGKNEITSEKVTVNIGFVDLGQIDLLVQEGFYSNRTDMIRTAIRNQLAIHSDVLKQTVAQKTLILGLRHYTKTELEKIKAQGVKLEIQVVGLVSIADDVPPQLAFDTIQSLVVLGAFHASSEIKNILKDKIL